MRVNKTIGIILIIVGMAIVILMLIADKIGITGAWFGLKRQIGTAFGLIMTTVGLIRTLPRNIGLTLALLIIFVTPLVIILCYGNPQWCRAIYIYQAYISPKYEYGISPPARYTGTWITWYPNGRKQYEDNYKDGKRDGIWTAWHVNGNKAEEAHYRDDRFDGRRICWDKESNVILREYYENGKVTRTDRGSPF